MPTYPASGSRRQLRGYQPKRRGLFEVERPTRIGGPGFASDTATVTTRNFTVPSGVASNWWCLFGVSWTDPTTPTVTMSGAGTWTQMISPTVEGNSGFCWYKGTGLTAGDVFTVTLSIGKFIVATHDYFDVAGFGPRGVIGSRGGVSQVTSTAPGIITTEIVQPVVVVGVERSTTLGTTVSVSPSGVVVRDYFGDIGSSTTTHFVGEFIGPPDLGATGSYTLTYSHSSVSGAAFLMPLITVPVDIPLPMFVRSQRAGGPLRRFRQYQPKMRPSFEVETAVSVVGPAVTGVGSVEQRTSVEGTGVKTGTGVGIAEQHSSVIAIGGRVIAGAGLTAQRALVIATGRKQGTGVSQVVQRSAIQAPGTKTGIGVANVVQRSATLSSVRKQSAGAGQVIQRALTRGLGQKQSTGAGLVVTRSSTSSAIRKQATGVAQVIARSTTSSVAAKTASGVGLVVTRGVTEASSLISKFAIITQRAVVIATGGKGGVGAGQVAQRNRTTSAVAKGGVGTGLVTGHSRTTSAVAKTGVGVGLVVARGMTSSAVKKTVSGVALVQQRSASTLVTASKSASGIARVIAHSAVQAFGIVTQPVIGLRIRVRGREYDPTISGRELDNTISGREYDPTQQGRESNRSISGREPRSMISGEEEGT
jgi:hypothetical protein